MDSFNCVHEFYFWKNNDMSFIAGTTNFVILKFVKIVYNSELNVLKKLQNDFMNLNSDNFKKSTK